MSLVPAWADIIRAEFPEETADVDIEAFADGQEKGYSVVVETFENQGEVRPLLREALDLIFTLGEEPIDVHGRRVRGDRSRGQRVRACGSCEPQPTRIV